MAQSTVSTGNTRYVVLESSVSAHVGFIPHAYCIEDSLRPNTNPVMLNYHVNYGSQPDSLYNSSASAWMSNFNINTIPAQTMFTVIADVLKGESYSLADVTGKCTGSGVFTESREQISLNGLPCGLYFLNCGNRHTRFYIMAE